MSDLGHHAEIVRDEQDAHADLLLQAAQEIQNLGLDGDVERRGRLVGDEQRGVARQRQRDHDALAHAAGHFVRILIEPPLRRRNLDELQHALGPRPRLAPGTPARAAGSFP